MRYETVEGQTHIYIEGQETEQQVLRAIVKASFELARPAGMGWMHFNDAQKMTDEVADQFVQIPPRHGSCVVEMDYVQGRQCKTYLHKAEDGHYTLANHSYERDRGTVEPMLDRAKEILSGKEASEGLASTEHMYKGNSLTLRLKEYGFTRNNGESDWDFRKRVFPGLYQKDPDRSLEFLLGASAAEWGEMDKMLVLMLVAEGKPNFQQLEKFAKGFGFDPAQARR